MQNDKWEKIIDVFNSALEVKESERRAFVEMQLNDDDESKNEVLELLESHEEAEGFIDEPPAQLAAELFSEDKNSSLGKQIGVYKIEKQIGHGGMGTVFLGIRADKEFEQKVAIKLLKRGMDTDEIIQRFKYERQILAELTHPNIAKLLDGGTTDDGLPYFVLEYVEGISISDYCDKNELSLTERLKLFRQVCDAISYAHQNLVVHRDIKPSNILVTHEGIPKLLDFGIAKVLQTDSDTPNLTVAGERLMTPKYASPEQVKGEQITTASDVYSLGVLLYELLTGTLPYNLNLKSPKQIEQIISEKEPTLPSKVKSEDRKVESDFPINSTLENENVETKSVAETSKPKPKSPIFNFQSSIFKGDLDNIALMALEKESQKRYTSVDDFSADIGRYLNGLPIVARKNTFVYRASKFVKRHKLGVAVASLFAILLIGFAINSTIQANRIAKEQKRSEQVLAFMRDIFKGNDPSNAGGKDISARELLDRGVVKIESELNSQTDVQAELLDTVGQVYTSLGLYDKAETLLTKALEKRRKFFGDGSDEVAETLLNLSDVQRLKANFVEANKSLVESLKIRQNLHGEKSAEVLNAKQQFVSLLSDEKKREESQKIAKETVELSKQIHGAESIETAKSLRELAMTLTNKPEEAEKFGREALAINRKVNSDANGETIETLNSLSKVLFYLRRDFDEAEKLLDESLVMSQKVYGKNHPQVSSVHKIRAWLFEQKKDFPVSIDSWQKALAVEEKLYGVNHPNIATTLNSIGANYFNSKKIEKAEETWQKALKIRQKSLGEEHPEVTWVISNLALLEFERKDYKKAEKLFSESLRIQKKGMPANHPQIGYSMVGLGKTVLKEKRAVEAEKLLREGIEIVNNSVDQYSWNSEEAENALGYSLFLQKKYDEARKKLKTSYEKIKEKNGVESEKTVLAKKRLMELSKAKVEN